MITTEITDTEIITVSDTGQAVVFDRHPDTEAQVIEQSQRLLVRADTLL